MFTQRCYPSCQTRQIGCWCYSAIVGLGVMAVGDGPVGNVPDGLAVAPNDGSGIVPDDGCGAGWDGAGNVPDDRATDRALDRLCS